MKLVRKTSNRWALTPKKKAKDYKDSIRYMGAFWDWDLKAWCVNTLEEGQYIVGWVKDFEKRYPSL